MFIHYHAQDGYWNIHPKKKLKHKCTTEKKNPRGHRPLT